MKQLEAIKVSQPIVFPYKFPYIPSEGDLVARQFIDSNGGRDRTRTCDLLRVKNSGSFYPFYLLL